MKKILITGADSYIGTSFEKWCCKYPGKYEVDTVDMRGGVWKNVSFRGYDAVFHVAGIAHVKTSLKNKSDYYKVNCDLAIETARKAKTDGVKRFILMSSMSVYGKCGKKIIDKNTIPKPNNVYGKSKLQAEEKIILLQDESFDIVIIRPPMVYGKNCKGNYIRLKNLTKYLLFFPDYSNKRSVIYIDTLCEFVRLIIDNGEKGVFCPQNDRYISTSELVQLLNPKIKLTKVFNILIKLFSGKVGVLDKLFGVLVYSQDCSKYKENYQTTSFEESVYATK